jgi:hypothetical protein
VTLNEFLTGSIAVLSLVVSGVTAWLTLFLRGQVRMTRPTIVAFAFEGPTPKVFLRFLLHSTAQRGNVIESMYVVMVQDGKRLLFSFWGYGDSQGSLVRGSGLFVSREGIGINHHFVRPKGEAVTPIEPGTCIVNIYASVLGQQKDELLQSVQLDIGDKEAAAINNPKAGLIYDWNPDAKQYRAEFR